MSKQAQPKPAFDPAVSFYSPKEEAPRVRAIKEAAQLLAEQVIEQTPEGADRMLALRSIEDAVLRSQLAITRQDAEKEVADQRDAEERKKRNAA
ncbi:MAG: hypothetical protein JNM12_09915 [Alphaproteobacteria bacterium]|nr:hypothetical protein [Alphaproteobacteria bacterium]